jgi:hypothetical protein
MSFTQPTGGITAKFLNDLRACRLSTQHAWSDASGATKYPVLTQATIGGAIEWQVASAGDVPLATIDERTDSILRTGELQRDGRVAQAGSYYVFRMLRRTDGTLWIDAITA